MAVEDEQTQAQTGEHERDRALGQEAQTERRSEGGHAEDGRSPLVGRGGADGHGQRAPEREQHVRHGDASEAQDEERRAQRERAVDGGAPVQEQAAQPGGGHDRAQRRRRGGEASHPE